MWKRLGVIKSEENWIPGELSNEQRGYTQGKGESKCRGGGGGRRPRSFVERQVSREWGNSNSPPPTTITKKEHKQINVVFFPSLNNDLCLSTIVVIIRKLNSFLALKVTHRNPVISFDNCLLIRHCTCKRHKFFLSFSYYKYFCSSQCNILIGIWKCKPYLKVLLYMTLLKMLRNQKLT